MLAPSRRRRCPANEQFDQGDYDMALTADAQLQIHALYVRCAIAFDNGDADGFAAAFTREGTFGVSGAQPVCGRAALAGYAERRFEQAPGTSHHICNILVEDDGMGGARGRAYGVILGTANDGRLQLRQAGSYEDQIVFEDGSWRFRSHVFTSRIAPGQAGLDLTSPSEV
jgi:SnoaL-like domain